MFHFFSIFGLLCCDAKVFQFNLLLTEYYCYIFYLFYLKILFAKHSCKFQKLKWERLLQFSFVLIVGYVDLNIFSDAADHLLGLEGAKTFWKSCCGHKLRVEVNKDKGVVVVIYCLIRNPRAPAATTLVF